MGISTDLSPFLRHRAERSARKYRRRRATERRAFTITTRMLEELVKEGAAVSLHVSDLDTGEAVVSGDSHVVLPIGGLGVVPLLAEIAVGFQSGTLDPKEEIDRSLVASLNTSGLWRHLRTSRLTLTDLAVFAASSGDPLAANALLDRIGYERVRARSTSMGFMRTALLDRFRDDAGAEGVPRAAEGCAKELAELGVGLVNSTVINAGVSAQLIEWLSLNSDLALAASATGLDPFGHDNDAHDLLLFNKTGRERGVRADAGALDGRRAGAAYALIIQFDDASIQHRLRVHEAFRMFSIELMEYVH